jgi:hypothetical protein
MAKEIPIGADGGARETVEFKQTLAAHHPELPPVYPRERKTPQFRAGI